MEGKIGNVRLGNVIPHQPQLPWFNSESVSTEWFSFLSLCFFTWSCAKMVVSILSQWEQFWFISNKKASRFHMAIWDIFNFRFLGFGGCNRLAHWMQLFSDVTVRLVLRLCDNKWLYMGEVCNPCVWYQIWMALLIFLQLSSSQSSHPPGKCHQYWIQVRATQHSLFYSNLNNKSNCTLLSIT